MLRTWRRGGAAWRAGTLAVLACALLLRLAVPAGWMPVADAHGLRLTLCGGMGPIDGPAAPAMHMAGSGHAMPGHDGHGGADHPCTFSALGAFLTGPALPPPLLLPSRVSAPRFVQHGVVAVGRGLAAPPPPSTGPPLLA